MIDLLVAGAGPAGAATAIRAALSGLSVVVVEPRATPIDKACGEGIAHSAVEYLSRLGVELPGRSFHGIRYLDGTHSVEARFTAGRGRGVRRTALQAALADRLAALDIPVLQSRVGPITQNTTSVTAAGITARYLAAADGLHSPIRRQLGLTYAPPDPATRLVPARSAPLDPATRSASLDPATRFMPPGPAARLAGSARSFFHASHSAPSDVRRGLRQHFTVAPWTDLVEVYWSRLGEAYVTPVADDLVGVAVLTSARGTFAEHLEAFPQLKRRLQGAPPASSVMGAGPLRQRVRARTAGRVLLVGDAAGYVDALTGEGIAVALRTSAELVDCVRADRPQDYEAAWRRVSWECRLLTASLLWARNRRLVAPYIVPAAARLPAVYRTIVNRLS
ncbi:NAD(P)/FAD-dependent oxidoreductase [Kribbella jejuensis]|uniref:Flavin-dependent dehydrogenase n=1 Tax=Kribbella jejuensis TaxID=236068 RepID=A0A542DBB3_9ACTN|nr:FAD-dependent monooxygenase [Kribbella jejuensis]TQJ00356.1 flavin-dependent dehydrogenase [Kribbella jejuensis]